MCCYFLIHCNIMINSTLHRLPLRRLLLLTKVNFVVGLSCHATAHATKGDVRNAVDDTDAGLFSIPVETDADAAENDGKAHQAVTATDETHIVLV